LRQEIPSLHVIITRPQVLYFQIRIIVFRIIRIAVIVLRFSKGDISGRSVAVGLPQSSLAVGYAAYVSSWIVGLCGTEAFLSK
ncbi:hypothetical protein PMZ82_22975, partial [[Clostridium] symbiosum]|uniref:hypothetical protein n=1 Tax=Clostridium symbiosum TaxID=1512 RepID=UPI00232D3808